MNRLLVGGRGGAICTHADSLCSLLVAVMAVFPSDSKNRARDYFNSIRCRRASYCRNAGVIISSMGVACEALGGSIAKNE